jgi:hypothetical protein
MRPDMQNFASIPTNNRNITGTCMEVDLYYGLTEFLQHGEGGSLHHYGKGASGLLTRLRSPDCIADSGFVWRATFFIY